MNWWWKNRGIGWSNSLWRGVERCYGQIKIEVLASTPLHLSPNPTNSTNSWAGTRSLSLEGFGLPNASRIHSIALRENWERITICALILLTCFFKLTLNLKGHNWMHNQYLSKTLSQIQNYIAGKGKNDSVHERNCQVTHHSGSKGLHICISNAMEDWETRICPFWFLPFSWKTLEVQGVFPALLNIAWPLLCCWLSAMTLRPMVDMEHDRNSILWFIVVFLFLACLCWLKAMLFSFASSSLPVVAAVAPTNDFLACFDKSTETQTIVVSAQEMRAFHHSLH